MTELSSDTTRTIVSPGRAGSTGSMASANPAGPAQSAAADAEAAAVKVRILSAYKQMLTYQFGGTVLLAGGTAAALFISYGYGKVSPPLLALVMLAGMLGAFFSALTRLYNVDQASIAMITPTIQQLGGRYLMMYSLVPPLIGAIAAIVLYLVFVGNLIQGAPFPAISCVKGQVCASLMDLMNNYWPTNPEDYGKALVWSFAAGFSERLVPDVLQGLANKAQTAEN
jgi:hypothetical protein